MCITFIKTDANKGITNIQYNFLNLPTQVTINGQNIMYTYDAAGTKLRKTVNGVTTDYAGGGALRKQLVTVFSERASWRRAYENNVLQFFNTPEGYVEPNGSNWNYVYQYKDHLGNIRLSYRDVNQNNSSAVSLIIKEENNYYPSGLKQKGYNANINGVEHKYKYNNKELQDELGLNWYDYGWRNYDAALGRWMGIDNLAEKYISSSPYHYASNNPIVFYDIDGNEYTKAAENEANRLRKKATEKKDENLKNIKNLLSKLLSGNLDDAVSDVKSINSSVSAAEEYDNTINELNKLENSTQLYDFKGGWEGSGVGALTWNPDNKAVVINVNSSTDIGQVAHEFKHASQFENGKLDLLFRSGSTYNGYLYDDYDEAEAYNRQGYFGNGTIYGYDNNRKPFLPLYTSNKTPVQFPSLKQAKSFYDRLRKINASKELSNQTRLVYRFNGRTFNTEVRKQN